MSTCGRASRGSRGCVVVPGSEDVPASGKVGVLGRGSDALLPVEEPHPEVKPIARNSTAVARNLITLASERLREDTHIARSGTLRPLAPAEQNDGAEYLRLASASAVSEPGERCLTRHYLRGHRATPFVRRGSNAELQLCADERPGTRVGSRPEGRPPRTGRFRKPMASSISCKRRLLANGQTRVARCQRSPSGTALPQQRCLSKKGRDCMAHRRRCSRCIFRRSPSPGRRCR
jgi:hypothetical protein